MKKGFIKYVLKTDYLKGIILYENKELNIENQVEQLLSNFKNLHL